MLQPRAMSRALVFAVARGDSQLLAGTMQFPVRFKDAPGDGMARGAAA